MHQTALFLRCVIFPSLKLLTLLPTNPRRGSRPASMNTVCGAHVPVWDDRIVQYYGADAAYGELRNIESEEDDSNTEGRQRRKTTTEREGEIYKRARSKYARTNRQDAQVMR
jgi:hypothetical protein